MYTISDSISLKIQNDNNLLAGVGNEIRLHTKDHSSTLPFKLKGKVHGIESEEWTNKLLIYGENEFIFILQSASHFEVLYRGCLSDWISSGKLLEEEGTFLLVTSHSVALLLKYNDITKSCEIQKKISCTDKSTLYSSYIYGSNWNNLVIFGGNAFGELLVWQPTIKSDEGSGRAKLLQRRPCHNGVIFSIDLDIKAKMLVTTSDDRSVRIWDILLSASCDFSDVKITNPKSGYSHVARVFKAKIIRECEDVYVLTGGEDSFFCLWNRKGELLFKRRQQFGATIWNLDYHSATKTILTAGSSGNIFKYGLQDCLGNNSGSASILSSQSLEPNEYIAKIKFLNESNFIAITNKNRLMHRHDDDEIKGEWLAVSSYVPCKCTVLEVYNGMIAIAGYQKVTLYNFMENNVSIEKIFEGKVLPGVIRSLIFLSKSEFLISDESGNCTLVRSHNFKDSVSIDLPQCKERWITAACKVDSEFLIASNRQGSLMLFSTSADDESSKPCSTIKRLHGHLGCTTVTLLKDYDSFSILKTTGHDYAIKTIKLNKREKTISVLSREMIPIAWVEKIVLSSNNNELLFGFNDNHFVLWSREMETHFEIPCGGGHRCWDLHIELSKNLVRTVFIKNKQVHLHQKTVFNKSPLTLNIPKNNWHVKPCNVLSCHKSNELFLVSGGEDNMLKISQFSSKSGTLQQLHVNYSHISSIRGLFVVWNATARKHVIFSCGGRAQICVSAFEEGSEFFEELIDYTIQKETKSQDIRCDPETRVMSIDVRQVEEDSFDIFVGCSDGYVRRLEMKKLQIFHVSEVFYGKCILHVRIAGDYLLSVGTDGVVCFWNINNFEVDFKIAHHESGVNSFDVRNVNGNEFHLITGGDDQDVVYSKIHLNSGAFKVTTLKRMNYLHTAQVTAVKFTPCMNYFYSSSIDQVVRKVNLETFNSNWELMSCVADVKGIELIEDSEDLLVFVYGCGLQVI